MHNADVAREKLFNVRFNADEWARMQALAEHYGIPAANVMRMLMKEKADALGIVSAAPASPKKKTTRK